MSTTSEFERGTLAYVIAWLEGGCDPKLAAAELRTIAAQANNRAGDILPKNVLDALRFYANGEHLFLDEKHHEFDTVSGEPQNWLMCQKEDSDDTTMLEDGSIARAALTGEPLAWDDGDEDHTPKPLANEIYRSIELTIKGEAT